MMAGQSDLQSQAISRFARWQHAIAGPTMPWCGATGKSSGGWRKAWPPRPWLWSQATPLTGSAPWSDATTSRGLPGWTTAVIAILGPPGSSPLRSVPRSPLPWRNLRLMEASGPARKWPPGWPRPWDTPSIPSAAGHRGVVSTGRRRSHGPVTPRPLCARKRLLKKPAGPRANAAARLPARGGGARGDRPPAYRPHAHPAARLEPPRTAPRRRRPAPVPVGLSRCLCAAMPGPALVAAPAPGLHRGLDAGLDGVCARHGSGAGHASPPGARRGRMASQPAGAGARRAPSALFAPIRARAATCRAVMAAHQRGPSPWPFPRFGRTPRHPSAAWSPPAGHLGEDPPADRFPWVAALRISTY